MSVNLFEENNTGQKFDIEDNDNEEINSLAKSMNEIEDNNLIPSTINNEVNQNLIFNNSTIRNLIDEFKENKSLYLYKDKIPEIRIKDEYELVNGEKIEIYINCPFNPNFDDSIYNICEKCRKNNNYFFCENCSINLCNICSEDCNKKHQNKLIKLIPDKIETYKREIKKIIEQYLIEPEKKEVNAEKGQKSYQVIDENKINDESINKIEYANDILLINNLINGNYNNYFHYKNIENCYKYMKIKYDINDQILIEYRIKNNQTKIQIFGQMFVKNNKGKCFIICENKEFELMEYFELKNNVNNDILRIKLIGINKITNMDKMFSYCYSLISVSDKSKWNTKIIISMGWMFEFCTSLKSLPDISNWDTNKVNNMSNMFYKCDSLKSLPDISKWNTNNVTDMSHMFFNCASLISLPDISNWNTNNVNDMSGIFNACSSLISLPDISKWNTNNVNNMKDMFSNCSSLISLPDISNWNTNNVNDMSYMFSHCSSLMSLPDISKWNTNKINYMGWMFYNCHSLISFPDISKWNTNNIKDNYCMFYNCFSLIHIPDISIKIEKVNIFPGFPVIM